MKTQWTKCLKLGFLMVLLTVSVEASALGKKNVCAITINSNDEINLFKKHLSPEQFNFIELTALEAQKNLPRDDFDAPDWFRESCRQQIQCDILVISGHFGGTFFGSSGLRLPIEALEAASCKSACSGILHQPKEVFLFGCNTLAGKEKDSRTPEQYTQVLIDDGFNAIEAQQIAAFRYSSFGSSFSDRMSRIFSQVPRIYGFSSISPSGKNAFPLLNKYLLETAPTYVEQITNATKATNKSLKENFKVTAFVQATGNPTPNTPVCYMQDANTSTISKLRYVIQVLEKGGALELAPFLSDYFHKLDHKSLNPAERRLLDEVYMNTSGREKLATFVAKPIPGLLKPQVDTLNLMRAINWISDKDYNLQIGKLALNPLYLGRPLTVEIKDLFCSLGIKISTLDISRIKTEYWENAHFYSILQCLSVQSPEIAEKLAHQIPRLIKNAYTPSVAQAWEDVNALRVILSTIRASGSLSEGVLEKLSQVPLGSRFQSVLFEFFKETGLASRKLRLEFERSMPSDLNKYGFGKNAEAMLYFLGRDEEEYINPRLEEYFNSSLKIAEQKHELFASALEQSKSLGAKVDKEIYHGNQSQRLINALLLKKINRENDPQLGARLLEIAAGPFSIAARIFSLTILTTDLTPVPEWHEKLVAIYKSNAPEAVRRKVLTMLPHMRGYDFIGQAPALIASEKNASLKNMLQFLFAEAQDSTARRAPYHQALPHEVLKPNFSSSLLADLKSGKVPYVLKPNELAERRTGIGPRVIHIGVTAADGVTDDIVYAPTEVLYNKKNNEVLAILTDSDRNQISTSNGKNGLFFMTDSFETEQMVIGALKISDLGAVEMDYSESLIQEQIKMLEKLKSENSEVRNLIEATKFLSFNWKGDAEGNNLIVLTSSEGSKKVVASGVLQLTPGSNGKGTAKITAVKVITLRP